MELTDGKTEIELEPDQPPTNIGLLITGILDDLYCLNEIENVDSITNLLDANNLPYERDLVMGRISTKLGLPFKQPQKLAPTTVRQSFNWV